MIFLKHYLSSMMKSTNILLGRMNSKSNMPLHKTSTESGKGYTHIFHQVPLQYHKSIFHSHPMDLILTRPHHHVHFEGLHIHIPRIRYATVPKRKSRQPPRNVVLVHRPYYISSKIYSIIPRRWNSFISLLHSHRL